MRQVLFSAVGGGLLVFLTACGPSEDTTSSRPSRLLAGETYVPINRLLDPRQAHPNVRGRGTSGNYAYAPAILHEDGVFHMYYCSTPDESSPGYSWDVIRHVWSTDGRLWSAPEVVLQPSNAVVEQATCDPSIVRYQRPGDPQPFYYLYYSGASKLVPSPVQQGSTVIFVARSSSPNGPFAKYDGRGWEIDSPSPVPLIVPAGPEPHYGVGQQSVVVKNGKLHVWYFDDSVVANGQRIGAIYHMETDSPLLTNQPSVRTSVQGFASPDVKYDPVRDRFVMFAIEPDSHAEDAYLTRRFSHDGVTWTTKDIVDGPESPSGNLPRGQFPRGANNLGVGGDSQGWLKEDRALIVYAAPLDRNPQFANDCQMESGSSRAPYCWGYWELYGSVINPSGGVWNEIPWGWQWQGQDDELLVVTGNWDGDRKADRALVRPRTGEWYVIASTGTPPFEWGWKWLGQDARHVPVVADYDGDGRTDRAIVNPSTGEWYVIGSRDGNGQPIPWGWKWPGQTPSHWLAVADYDGDGKADRAIVNPDTGRWQWIPSSRSPGQCPCDILEFTQAVMGRHHLLAVADYDGDGKADPASVDPFTGTWYVKFSNPVNAPFPAVSRIDAQTPDIAVASADYDGDGRADRAVVDRGRGKWYVHFSAGGQSIPLGWQWAGQGRDMQITPADYDGDGRADRVLVDRQAGRWYVMGSAPFRIYQPYYTTVRIPPSRFVPPLRSFPR